MPQAVPIRAQGATRRGLLALLAVAPLGGAATAAFAQAPCVDVAALPSSQRSMRKSLNFMVASDDPKRQCAGCSFFTGGEGGCGRCSIFNGPTPAGGRCDSWAPRK